MTSPSKPRPFFDDGQITIYHGDCRETAPLLGFEGLVLTDPPYGMNYKPLRGGTGSKRFREGIVGDDRPFDPWFVDQFSQVCTWGANWYARALPATGGWLVWDKVPRGVKEGFQCSHCDLAWTSFRNSMRIFRLQWGGEARNGEKGHYHPNQKPVALMRWCIDTWGQSGDVLDLYMGSGTTLRAAKDCGRRVIGIELSGDYCEKAAQRISQQVLPGVI